MDDSLGTALLVVLAVFALVAVALAVTAFWLLRRYRAPLHAVAATAAAVLYVLSPADAVPEVLLGPVGLTDDLAVIIGALLYFRRLARARRDRGPAVLPSPAAPSRHPTEQPPSA